MTRIDLDVAVVVTDQRDRRHGEVGFVRNDWLALNGDRVYNVEFADGYGEHVAAEICELTCPDCGTGWQETMRPCEGCGLTVAQVVERTMANG